jgi:hypothetical protein
VAFGYVGLGLFALATVSMMAVAVWGRNLNTDFDPWLARGGLAMAVAISLQQIFETNLYTGMKYVHMTFWMALTLAMMPLFYYRSATKSARLARTSESSPSDIGPSSL